MTTSHHDVLVHGGGIVSRAVALALAARGLRVGLSRRQAAPSPATASPGGADIRAYALNAASRELLQALRAWPDDESRGPVATPVRRMAVWGDDGGQVEFDAARLGVDALAWIVDVPALERRLEQAVDFQPLVQRLDEADMALDPAAVQPGPGNPPALHVICEGRASRLRDLLGVEWDPLPYGQQAIAARLQCGHPHDGVARQWFVGGEVLALLPLDGPGGNSVALVWSVHDDHARRLMSLDDDAFCAELAAACGGPGHEAAGAPGTMRLSGARACWALRSAQARRLCGPGWVLAGDAAHTVHPLAGQGLNLGLGDAAALARTVGGREPWRAPSDPRLLRAYERERRAEMATRGQVSDRLFQLFAHTDARVQTLRNAGMNLFTRIDPVKQLAARAAMGVMQK